MRNNKEAGVAVAETGRDEKWDLRLQRCRGQIFHALAGQGMELYTVHHVRLHGRDPNELQLSDLSPCGVFFPLEFFSVTAGNWRGWH